MVRDLETDADYAACVNLQRETWGHNFTEAVPATMLRIAQKLGGVAAGAFENDRLIGFVFGLTGLKDGAVVHWSDMLAVRPEYRNRGIGEELKRYQRDRVLERGITRMFWTFDPLDAKNAHINFNRLGVYAREYVVDMYGCTESPLHAHGTDRLIVTWELNASRGSAPAPIQATTHAPEIAIPLNIHALGTSDAAEWRAQTRAQFLRYLPEYVVTGFVKREDAGYYALTSASNFTT